LYITLTLIVLLQISVVPRTQSLLNLDISKMVKNDHKSYEYMLLKLIPFIERKQMANENDVKMLIHLLILNEKLINRRKTEERPVYWYSRQGR
jgi:hypothetical protein